MCSVVAVHDAAVVISRSQSQQIAMPAEHAEIGCGGRRAVHRKIEILRRVLVRRLPSVGPGGEEPRSRLGGLRYDRWRRPRSSCRSGRLTLAVA